MAFDPDLAHRIRELVSEEKGLTEKQMFGGLAFFVNGNMAVTASGKGGLLVRVDPAESDALLERAHVRPFETQGRELRGWLRVADEGIKTKRQLRPWVTRGIDFARSLPPKR